MPVTFQVVGNLADFGNEPRAGVKVRATASPGQKVGDISVHSNQPETVVTDEDGAFALELVSLPGVWYRIHTPYSGALPTINLAGYVPDVDDPTTGTAFPEGTVIDVKDVADENPTPGYEAVLMGPVGPQGPTGPKGDKGDKGDTGPAGTTTWAGITDKPTLGTAAATDASAYATAAQGAKADNAVQPAALTAYARARPASALLSFYAAAANRETTPVRIAMIGDSIQEGDGVSDYFRRPQSLLADRLLARWPVPGLTSQGVQHIGGWQENGTAHTAPMTLTGVSGTDYLRAQMGLPRRSVSLKTTSGVWSMTAPRQMTSFDVVFHRNNSGGVANIKVDGVSVGTFNTLNATAIYSSRQHYEVTPGPHTVSVHKDATATGGSSIQVDAVIVYETAASLTKGFHVWDGAHSGYRVADFLTGVNISADLAAINPHLIIISLGANDEQVAGAKTPDQFYADLTTMIGYRDGCANKPGIVLMPTWKRSDVALVSHAQYVAKQYLKVTEDPRNAILDLNLYFPDIADGASPAGVTVAPYWGLYYDGVHPTVAGASMLADLLATYLAPPA